jgi:hypothetical protein
MFPLTPILSGAVGLSLAAAGGLWLMLDAERARNETLALEIETWEAAQSENLAAIARLQGERDILALELEAQREREERIRRASDDRLRQLRELQRSSPDVQTFTRLRTPADLCRLHAPAGREADCADGDGEN